MDLFSYPLGVITHRNTEDERMVGAPRSVSQGIDGEYNENLKALILNSKFINTQKSKGITF